MRHLRSKSLYLSLCLLSVGLAWATIAEAAIERPPTEVSSRAFIDPALRVSNALARIDDLTEAGSAEADLLDLGVAREAALLDRRGGRWGALYPAIPLIPGGGVGNALSWDKLRLPVPSDAEAVRAATQRALESFLKRHRESLRIEASELDFRSRVLDDGELVQFSSGRKVGGIPVRGTVLTAVVNAGNLNLMGTSLWGDVEVDLNPALSADDALVEVARYLAPVEIERLTERASLVIVPTARPEPFDVGAGYEHRLVWSIRPEIADEIGQWEALVEAHSGRLLAFQDLNHYQTARNVNGGVYPLTDDGIPPGGVMADNFPMPYADLSTGGFGDSGGNFTAAGSSTTTLQGQFITIDDGCGTISESSTGDVELGGTDGDTDCVVPAGASLGNTAAARTTFFELNRIREVGSSWLGNTPWLGGTLNADTNVATLCNAFWTGLEVRFYSEGTIPMPCANTGQVAGVIDHEWGHGMDDNDVDGSIPPFSQGGGEGMADIYAALRQDDACIGRGFWKNGVLCTGYGDPCTPASGCTGIRSVDFADRTSGVPHTLTWVRANCGFTTHCLGAAYAEAIWDLLKRDLPTFYGTSNDTALELVMRTTFIAAGNASGWFTQSGPPPGGAGCGATQAYLQYLATDDDDGNIANGTPHMSAIAAAFDRHEIGCTPAFGGPVVQDSGCVGTPTVAPVVSAIATDTGADLTWSAVPNAISYVISRTDGVFQCNQGKAVVGAGTGTTFSDSGLKNDHDYYYVVTPMGPGRSCVGPASACERPFAHFAPDPGTAGVQNTLTAAGATPSSSVFFYLGRATGTSQQNVPGCGTLTLDIGLSRRLGSSVSGLDGVATLTRFLPGTLSGLTLGLQAVDTANCETSNVAVDTF